jgi:hypothetical protein
MEDIFITIEPNWYEYCGETRSEGWSCTSLVPALDAIGRTRVEALKNWEDLYWMYSNPDKVENIMNTMLQELHSEKA